MARKPSKPVSNFSSSESTIDWNAIKKKVKAGSRPCRISLFVELGTQEREPIVEDYEETEAQEKKIAAGKAEVFEEGGKKKLSVQLPPAEMIAGFVDLTDDVVTYGDLGDKPYRLNLHNYYKGVIKPLVISGVTPKDKNGKYKNGADPVFPPRSTFRRLATACGQEQINREGKDSMDIDQLLNKPMMATVEKRESDDGKFVNVDFKGCSPLPELPGGIEFPVPPLAETAMRIGFNDVFVEELNDSIPLTAEYVKRINRNLLELMKKAPEYEGSVLEKILSGQAGDQEEQAEDSKETKPKAEKKPTEKKKEVAPKKETKKPAVEEPIIEEDDIPSDDEWDDDVPF